MGWYVHWLAGLWLVSGQVGWIDYVGLGVGWIGQVWCFGW